MVYTDMDSFALVLYSNVNSWRGFVARDRHATSAKNVVIEGSIHPRKVLGIHFGSTCIAFSGHSGL